MKIVFRFLRRMLGGVVGVLVKDSTNYSFSETRVYDNT